MNSNYKTALAVMAIVGLSISACKDDASDTLGDYFEAKSAYGAVLDEWLGQQNDTWRVIPIYGPVYEPGTPLEPGSTEPLTDNCLVSPEDIIDDPMTTFPRVSAKRSFNIGANIPDSIEKAKSLMVSGGAGLSTSAESVLDYKNLKQRAVRRDVFDESLMRPECLAVIAGQEVTIVRGQIIGQETISSKQALSANVTVEVLSDEALNLKYDRSGAYELEDDAPNPKYFYVYNRTFPIEIPPNATMSMRRAIVEDFLRTESSARVRFVDSRTSDGDVEAIVRTARGSIN